MGCGASSAANIPPELLNQLARGHVFEHEERPSPPCMEPGISERLAAARAKQQQRWEADAQAAKALQAAGDAAVIGTPINNEQQPARKPRKFMLPEDLRPDETDVLDLGTALRGLGGGLGDVAAMLARHGAWTCEPVYAQRDPNMCAAGRRGALACTMRCGRCVS